jgi:hypothetical protein
MQFRNLFLSAALCVPMALSAQTMDRPAGSNADQPDAAPPAAEAQPEAQPSSAAGGSASDERLGFQTLDENEDGFISRDEAKGTYLANRFDALDTDHDGRLSPSEVGAGSPE